MTWRVARLSVRASVALGFVLCAVGAIAARSGNIGEMATAQATTNDIPSAFRPFYSGALMDTAAALSALPCERISLERSGGMLVRSAPSTPVEQLRAGDRFKVTLFRTGEATFRTSRGEEFVAAANPFALGKLCHLATKTGLRSARYDAPLSDGETVTVEIAGPTAVITVVDYAGGAPPEVWAIEQAIEAIAYAASWKRK